MNKNQIIIFSIILCHIFVLSNCKREKNVEKKELKELVFYNWKNFTDKSILKDFEKETGIKVVLKEYETRDMCIAQLQTNPGLCDVLILDTTNITYFKRQKLIKEFNLSKIPNSKYFNNYIKSRLTGNLKNQLPYMTGVNGIAINTKYVPANSDSWNIFWQKKYKNRVVLLDDMREAIASVLFKSHLSANENDPEKLKIAEKNAVLLKKNGITFGETFTNLNDLLKGKKWIVQTYNGDFIWKTKGRSEFKFIYPKEGFLKWIVIFALHSDVKNYEGAHKFVNFMLRPDISARSATTFSYQAPIIGVEKYMDKKLSINKIMNPPEDVLKRGELYRDMGKSTKEYQKIFNLMKK
jgi:spermidine/putrescine transport system substrate-binding protein